jgi:hypothetical protein
MRLKAHVIRALVLTQLLSVSWMAKAQSASSSIQGTVTDSSGAAIPAAAIVLTNTKTGVVLKTQSDSAGNYLFPTVQPGQFSLVVNKQEFATYDLAGFSIEVGQHATENAPLSVGSASQNVTVEANGLADLLDTQSNDLGTVIGRTACSSFR